MTSSEKRSGGWGGAHHAWNRTGKWHSSTGGEIARRYTGGVRSELEEEVLQWSPGCLGVRAARALYPKSARVARSLGYACKERVREAVGGSRGGRARVGWSTGRRASSAETKQRARLGDCGRRKGKELTRGPGLAEGERATRLRVNAADGWARLVRDSARELRERASWRCRMGWAGAGRKGVGSWACYRHKLTGLI